MLNFAAQAARDCRAIAADLRAGGLFDDATTVERMAERITQAQHFELPENGSLFDDDLRALAGVELRLPYPVITASYIARHPTDGILRRMALAEEIERADGLWVRVVAFAKAERWTPVPIAIELPSQAWEDLSAQTAKLHELADDPDICPPAPPRYQFRPVAILPGLLDGIAQDRKETARVILSATGPAESVMEMLEALSCANVRADIAERVDPRVNARRIRDGKLPLWETRVLTVLCPRHAIARTASAGDRASPRQHLRRGHVRHLGDDRRIWIQPALVGDPVNGRIRKFYDVRVAA